ncbi:MAG: hypothetical protein QOF70_5717 [Acetobacteraceae bacterium]|jgi:hypothetical protein|nr:hypothetical protein [Acetobacteraceae bacterium]
MLFLVLVFRPHRLARPLLHLITLDVIEPILSNVYLGPRTSRNWAMCP